MRKNIVYFKSIVAGIATAIAALLLSAILVTLGTFALLQFEIWRQRDQGSGGIGAVSAGIGESIVIVGLILGLLGFVAGFWWEFRRASQ